MQRQHSILAIVLVALFCAAVSAQKIADIFESTSLSLVKTASFGEGPRWHPDGYLLFTEYYINQISKFDGSTVSVFKSNANATVTLWITPSKQIYLGQGLLPQAGLNAGRGIASTTANSSSPFTSHTTTYTNKKYSSLWDIWMRPSDSTLFFIDNDYLFKKFNMTAAIELSPLGVYSMNTKTNVVTLLTTSIISPSGLALSNDEKKLLVGDMADNKVYSFDVSADGLSLSNKQVFTSIVSPVGNVTDFADGICTDNKGYVYINGAGGLYVYTSTGTVIGVFDNAGVHVTNCFQGGDGYLYVTTIDALKRVQYKKSTSGAASLNGDNGFVIIAMMLLAMLVFLF